MFKKAANFYKTYSLDPLGIDSFSEELEEELIKLNIERQNRLKIRLSLEESLLRFLDQFGTSEKFAVSINRVFGKPTIQIELEQNIFNPLSKIENDLSDWNGSLLTSAGLNPQFLYARGVNILRIVLPAQRMNPVLKIAIAIALGVGFGVLGLYCLPASTQETLGTVFFQPLYNVWNRLLLAVCGSVIFFMVITTLLDMRTVSEQGGRNRVVVGRYFGFTLIPALVAALLAQLVLMPNFEASESSEAMSTDFLDELFFHIVPANPFTPLIESNTPQILLMAYVLGTALVMLGPKAKHLSRLVQQINLVGMQLAEWISRLVPYFTAILVCYQILVGPRRLLVGVWKPLCLSLLVSIGFTFIVLLYVSKKKQVTINLLLNKLKAPFLMALKTGSLDASYGLTEQSCVAGLGIERHFASVSLPHGLILYMPVNVIGTLIFIIYAANHYNITVTPIWFGVAIILAILLFVATPPVPGMNLLAYIAIFSQLGIASNALIDAMIFDIVFGIFAAAGNQLLLQLELVLQADRIGLLNKKILQRVS